MNDISTGIGRSDKEESFEAGKEAALEAVNEISGDPKILFVFAAREYDRNELLKGVCSVSGTIPMIGGTTAGELSTKGFSTNSVVVLALNSNSLEFTTGIGVDMGADELQCGKSLVADLSKKHTFDDALSLLVFPDGLGGDGCKVIDGINSALTDKLEIVGGCLGDGDEFGRTYQFYDGNVYEDSIPGLLISGKSSFRTGIGVRSGFESIGNKMFCTESDGNIVKKIDGVNALELYKELLGEERSKRLPGIFLEYPFGLIDEKVAISGEEYFQLRCGLTADENEGSISCAGSIPEGSAITITAGSRSDLINGARLAAEQAKTSLGDVRPKLTMVFSCVGRKLVLGRRVSEEIDVVQKTIGSDVPLIGFYTYGEIGPIDKDRNSLCEAKFHNETLVIWVIGN